MTTQVHVASNIFDARPRNIRRLSNRLSLRQLHNIHVVAVKYGATAFGQHVQIYTFSNNVPIDITSFAFSLCKTAILSVRKDSRYVESIG